MGAWQRMRRTKAAVLSLLVQAYQPAARWAEASRDVWARLGIAPLLTRLDHTLLMTVPALGKTLSDKKETTESRQSAGEQLIQVLSQLHLRPPQGDILPGMVAVSGWPLAAAALARPMHDRPAPPASPRRRLAANERRK